MNYIHLTQTDISIMFLFAALGSLILLLILFFTDNDSDKNKTEWKKILKHSPVPESPSNINIEQNMKLQEILNDCIVPTVDENNIPLSLDRILDDTFLVTNSLIDHYIDMKPIVTSSYNLLKSHADKMYLDKDFREYMIKVSLRTLMDPFDLRIKAQLNRSRNRIDHAFNGLESFEKEFESIKKIGEQLDQLKRLNTFFKKLDNHLNDVVYKDLNIVEVIINDVEYIFNSYDKYRESVEKEKTTENKEIIFENKLSKEDVKIVFNLSKES